MNTLKSLHLSFQWGTLASREIPLTKLAPAPTAHTNPTSQPRVSASSVSQRTEFALPHHYGNQRRTKGCLGDHNWVKLHIPSIRTFSDPDKAVQNLSQFTSVLRIELRGFDIVIVITIPTTASCYCLTYQVRVSVTLSVL